MGTNFKLIGWILLLVIEIGCFGYSIYQLATSILLRDDQKLGIYCIMTLLAIAIVFCGFRIHEERKAIL